MSAIFGLVDKSSLSINSDKEISGMRVWNLAYGRTSQGIEKGSNFFIGCCINRITDIPANCTPIIRTASCYYAIDALLYNREELLLACNSSVDLSDEELLVSYINAKGLDALKDVNGDFSGAIYDPNSGELTLFRDHMGIRPLYFFINKEFISFSTDIRGITGLLRANITLDDEWIYKTLNGFIAIESENTEYKNIYCVKPGSYLKVSKLNNTMSYSVKTYWEPGRKKFKLRSDRQYQSYLKELITDSVKRRLTVTAKPVGAELSGGLDSGVISILINRLGHKCHYYSWSYSPEILPYAEKDERLVIDDICKQEQISCNYQHYIPNMEAPLNEYLQFTGLCSKNDPFFMEYALPAYINALTIKDTSLFMNHSGVKLVFSGHGGDEGVSHRSNSYEMAYNHEYYHYLRYMWSRSHGQKHRLSTTFKNIKVNIRESKKAISEIFVGPFKAPELMDQTFLNSMKSQTASILYFAYDPIKYIKHGGSRNRLDNTALLGALCNVQYVFPYLDYRVIDFAVSIPRYQFLRGRRNRYIFREAFKDIMPESLYRVTDKYDGSAKNLKPNPNWLEDYQNTKKETITRLDKKIWNKYLDYDKLNNFLNKENPTREEVQQDYLKIQALTFCIMAQNALEKSREVSRNLSNDTD